MSTPQETTDAELLLEQYTPEALLAWSDLTRSLTVTVPASIDEANRLLDAAERELG